MRFRTTSVKEIAGLVAGQVEGEVTAAITGVSPLEAATAGDLTFCARAELREHLLTTPAAAVLVGDKMEVPRQTAPALIRVANPYFAFLQVIKQFVITETEAIGVDPSARIAETAVLAQQVTVGPFTVIEPECHIGEQVRIGAGCYLGRGVVIGEQTVIFPGVTIHHDVRVGRRVIIQAGAVIGSDGFGYVHHDDRFHKIPHLGTVVLEDEVEIGANCCIDRGTFGETHIHRGVKLDNLVHIAHNVEIDEHTVMAAQSGISGSTKIGRYVTIAGQVGMVGHITIGDHSTFGAQAGVTKSIPAKLTVSGYPAKDHLKARKEEAALRRLPELLKRVRQLEKLLGATMAANGVE